LDRLRKDQEHVVDFLQQQRSGMAYWQTIRDLWQLFQANRREP